MNLNTWKSIKVGIYKNYNALQRALRRINYEWERDPEYFWMFKPKPALSQVEEEIRLCRMTVEELTGKPYPSHRQVLEAIARVGAPRPLEVGPALRAQYPDQPVGEILFFICEDVVDSTGQPRLVQCSIAREYGNNWLYRMMREVDWWLYANFGLHIPRIVRLSRKSEFHFFVRYVDADDTMRGEWNIVFALRK